MCLGYVLLILIFVIFIFVFRRPPVTARNHEILNANIIIMNQFLPNSNSIFILLTFLFLPNAHFCISQTFIRIYFSFLVFNLLHATSLLFHVSIFFVTFLFFSFLYISNFWIFEILFSIVLKLYTSLFFRS